MRKIPVTETRPETEAAQPHDGSEAKSSAARSGEGAPADQEETDDPIKSLEADLHRFRDLALRTQADFENYKKRCAREKEEAIKYANSSLLERLIAIVDNFELGLEAARGEGEKSPILAGMNMVLKQLTDFLADNGLQAMDATNQKFDPNLHEAIAHESNEKIPEGIVIRQTRRGYRMKDRLLRPSSVVVSSGAAV